RMYDAQIGRFGQTDPLAEQSANASEYAFVLNNPVSMVDPMGLQGQNPYAPGSTFFDNNNGDPWWWSSRPSQAFNIPKKAMDGGGGGVRANGLTASGQFFQNLIKDIQKHGDLVDEGTYYYDTHGEYISDPNRIIVYGNIKNGKWKTSSVEWGNSNDNPYGDHTLDIKKLPENNNSNVQVGNFCVFKTMEWAGRFYGSKSQSGVYLMAWIKTPPGHINDMQTGFNGTISDLSNLLNQFFETSPSWNMSISIDYGKPVFGFIANAAPNTDYHAVLVTGYNDNATVVYFDPQSGKYVSTSPTNILNPIQLNGLH
ncbi:MAG: hypothetical protein JSS98_03410, partial [Bacteroidetes bacterium]|nr:hypothetical protein [Bacteroidota bacterium]